MASQVLGEPEPDFVPLADFGEFGLDDFPLFESTLESVASQISFGDTNSAVPGRLLGRVEAYLEAGAYEYVLETIRYGYKLIFKHAPPPRDFRPNNKSALSNPDFLYSELLRL